MSSLVQGVLSSNSVSPDVNIQEYRSNFSREQLKHAINKSFIQNKNNKVPIISSAKTKIKSIQSIKPKLTEKNTNLADNNQFALELAKISTKLENLEKHSKLLEGKYKEERTLELEKKMNEITEERLKYLEKLQHEQEQWKSQYFQTIKKINEANYITSVAVTNKGNCHDSNVKHQFVQNSSNKKSDILKTPMPRKIIPQPCSEQVGNGKFLQDILDQYSASTPNISHSKNIGPIDTIPVRLSDSQMHINDNINLAAIPPSPIKPSKQELVEKEIEDEAERKKISEKFPVSISEYLPVTHMSPVSQTLIKTVPQSSVVADFRQQLRKLIEIRSNLENNLQAVQRKPKLDNIATAALLEQLNDDDNWLAIGNEKMCWIQKLVDEQIVLNEAKIKEEVANELKNKKFTKSKQLVSNNYKRNQTVKNLKPKKSEIQSKKRPTKSKVENYMKLPFEKADESAITHIYGKAEYHPHRTTVHNPFMHISPIKSPKFRTKRVLHAVPATYVRSEKTQTCSSPTLIKSKYLAPTAISLGPPCIHENDPDPIIVESPKPIKVVPRSCPQQKVEVICCPNCNGCGCPCCIDCKKEVKLHGAAECMLSPKSLSAKKVSPCIIKKTTPDCKKVSESIGPVCDAEKVKCWVEHEIMAKILTELYPSQSNQNTQTADFSDSYIKTLVEDELRLKIQQKLLQRSLYEKKKLDVLPPANLQTPLPTPQPSPSVSEAESSIATQHQIETPPLSVGMSAAESECICEVPETSETPDPPSSEQEFEATIVPTPQETPASSPEVSEKRPTPEPVKSELTFTDPWEGKPPKEDWILPQPFKVTQQLAPEPEAKNLVVQIITPPPASEKNSFSSESSSSEENSKSEDKSISQGQLLIEHGEMKPKKRLPLNVPCNLENLVNQSTLRDVPDIEPISEGEFRPNIQPSVMPKKLFNYVEDDPTSVYAHPRYPGTKTPEPDELSVGEIPDKKQRNRFERWKASKQASIASLSHIKTGNNSLSAVNIPQEKNDNSLAIDDLNSTSLDSASLSEGLAPNVIRVTSANPHTLEGFQNNPLGIKSYGTGLDSAAKNSLGNILPVKPRSQMNFILPTTDPVSGASDTEDISAPDF